MPRIDDFAVDQIGLYMVALYATNNWSNPRNDLVKLLTLWATCNLIRIAITPYNICPRSTSLRIALKDTS